MLPTLLSGQAQPAAQTLPSPPATRLEGFKPNAGTLVTFGYDELGAVGGVSVDAREMKSAQGGSVRGLVVEVAEGQYRTERAFVDADEIAELIRGIDALLAVRENPTTFRNFEVQYKTRGDLQLVAFNTSTGGISYSVRAGRVVRAQRFLGENGMRELREMLVNANQKLSPLGGR